MTPDLLTKLEALAKDALGVVTPPGCVPDEITALNRACKPRTILSLIAAVREARDLALEETATVAECWRDGNPTAVADIGWTGRTIAKAIRALKSKPSGDV